MPLYECPKGKRYFDSPDELWSCECRVPHTQCPVINIPHTRIHGITDGEPDVLYTHPVGSAQSEHRIFFDHDSCLCTSNEEVLQLDPRIQRAIDSMLLWD